MLHGDGGDVKSLLPFELSQSLIFQLIEREKKSPIWSQLDELEKWRIWKICVCVHVYVVGEGIQSPLGVLEQGT